MESRMPAAPPAVGEKKREDSGLCGPLPAAAAEGFTDLPTGAPFKRSRDMVEFAPTTLYMPRLPVGMAAMVLISVMFCVMAARLTERCSDHATRARHTSRAAPKKARTAPTQMKTVPSGRFDFCIKGAPAVFGTCWTGTPTPASVGAPARLKTLVEPVWATVVVAEVLVSEVAGCVGLGGSVAGCVVFSDVVVAGCTG